MKEAFKVKLEFKNKIGAGAKAARMGMKFARGGLIGMGKKDHDEDPPVTITLRANRTAVVQAKQHLLAFDTKGKTIPWSVEYAAPAVPNWERLVMFAITATAKIRGPKLQARPFFDNCPDLGAMLVAVVRAGPTGLKIGDILRR